MRSELDGSAGSASGTVTIKKAIEPWRARTFQWIAVACLLFVVFTSIAMFFFRDGSADIPVRYSFFNNFFSELGLTETSSGRTNPVSAVLFFVSMVSAGGALALFFLLFPIFFSASRPWRLFSLVGSALGVMSGICFVGVAFTPANLFVEAHIFFVIWAFRLFPMAVIPYIFSILGTRRYPNRYALVFFAFAVLLVAYLVLLTNGPSPATDAGRVIQVTGQKIIGYASVISIYLQSTGARKLLLSSDVQGTV
jgi:hypothetical protein